MAALFPDTLQVPGRGDKHSLHPSARGRDEHAPLSACPPSTVEQPELHMAAPLQDTLHVLNQVSRHSLHSSARGRDEHAP